MPRRTLAALVVALLCVVPGLAEDKKKTDGPKKPVGTWTRSAGDAKVTFAIKADGLRITIARGEAKIEADADYGVSKDGTLFGRLNKVTKSGIEGGPSEGDLFSFSTKVEKDKMTIGDLKSSGGVNDDARQLVEGDYEKGK